MLVNAFNIVAWNAQSINNKHDTISHFLSTHTPSILAVTESHCRLSTHALTAMYTSNTNYTCISYPHTRATQGGTVFFVHSSVHYRVRFDLDLKPNSLKSSRRPSSLHWLQLKVPSKPHPML